MATCAVDGCTRSNRITRGRCSLHYARALASGELSRVIHVPRLSEPTCTIDGCDRPYRCKGLCSLHYDRLRRHGDPLEAGVDRSNVGYYAAHQRVWNAWGKATEHSCAQCDAPAQEWAYDHSDPEEQREARTSQSGLTRTLPYSLDVNRYLPMCKPCHSRFDAMAMAVAA